MSLFDSTLYYRLISEQYDPDRALSLQRDDPPSQVYMSRLEDNYTSTNWQLFYQKGIYFIRNHDHNLTYHLGVNNSMSDYPTMLPASTDVGQQWSIDQWSDDNSTYKLVNNLEPNIFLGVVDFTSVTMWNVEHGAHWTVLANSHMGTVTSDMLQPYSVLDQDPTGTNGTTPLPSQTDNFFVPGEWLPIDKAGVAIGILVMASAVALVFFWWRKSKKQAAKRGPIIVPGSRRSFRHNPGAHGDAQIVNEPPPAYNARPNSTFANHDPSLHPEFGGYYSGTTNRRKSADDTRSIELPPYGSPSAEGRSFV